MTAPAIPPELDDHLCRHSALDASEASRLIGEVLAYYGEDVEAFVRRRHHELRARGLANAAIYDVIARELPLHRFPAAPLSLRQIRRLIYG